jgi:UrcA family protein
MIKHAAPTLAALVLAAGTFAVPAVAADTQSATVRIDDLDLTSKAGLTHLQRRLRAAADDICGEVPVLPLQRKRITRACHNEVLASSREQVALATARAQSKVRLARREDEPSASNASPLAP